MASLDEYRRTFPSDAIAPGTFVDGSLHLTDPDFRPAHLFGAVCAFTDPDLVSAAFNRDEDEIEQLAQELCTGPWLTFTTPIGDCELSVIYRNDDDSGVDYVV